MTSDADPHAGLPPAAADRAADGLLDRVAAAMPVAATDVALDWPGAGLVVIDVVNGFATVGAGPLAPPRFDAAIAAAVAECDRLARRFAAAGRPIAVFLDTHRPGVPEPPYPPHCEVGSGEEELVPALQWLGTCAQATLIEKDCINAFVGAHDHASGRNRIVDWILRHRLRSLVVVGLCTDICVMDFVLTMLSARNHGHVPGLADIVVHAPGCATYDLPRAAAAAAGLPATAAHPQALADHLGLYFMASRGAVIARRLIPAAGP
jgi:nicotinamidase-related amidase